MPTTDTYGQGTSLASLTDAPDIPKAIVDLATGVIPRGVMRFASASARGVTLTSPVEGMVTWLQDIKSLQVYSSGSWKAIFFGATSWTSYTPTWTATTTSPAIGNGVLAGSYMKIGTMCHVNVQLTIGSTTNRGSGTYRFALPFQAASSVPGVLSATFSRASTPNHGLGDSPLVASATATDQIWFPNPGLVGDANVWTESQPWTPATGNIFRLYGTYQTAT